MNKLSFALSIPGFFFMNWTGGKMPMNRKKSNVSLKRQKIRQRQMEFLSSSSSNNSIGTSSKFQSPLQSQDPVREIQERMFGRQIHPEIQPDELPSDFCGENSIDILKLHSIKEHKRSIIPMKSDVFASETSEEHVVKLIDDEIGCSSVNDSLCANVGRESFVQEEEQHENAISSSNVQRDQEIVHLKRRIMKLESVVASLNQKLYQLTQSLRIN